MPQTFDLYRYFDSSGKLPSETPRSPQGVRCVMKADTRTVIVLDNNERLHDVVNQILHDIIPRKDIRQLDDGGLRDGAGAITAARMQSYLGEHLRFYKDGVEVEPPMTMMKFILARYREFPAVVNITKYSK